MKTILEYLHENKSAHDGVKISTAFDAAKMLLEGKLSLDENENYQHPLIWGEGWYAIYKEDFGECSWYVSPKKYFEEKGRCPDGWDWEIPEGMDSDDLDEFIDDNGCEPDTPMGFSSCEECNFTCYRDWSIEKQRDVLREAGFIVDNVPKWYYER